MAYELIARTPVPDVKVIFGGVKVPANWTLPPVRGMFETAWPVPDDIAPWRRIGGDSGSFFQHRITKEIIDPFDTVRRAAKGEGAFLEVDNAVDFLKRYYGPVQRLAEFPLDEVQPLVAVGKRFSGSSNILGGLPAMLGVRGSPQVQAALKASSAGAALSVAFVSLCGLAALINV